MSSFTTTYQDLLTEGPVIEVVIAIPEDQAKALRREKTPVTDPVTVKGLIDTGADRTVVNSHIANYLNLRPHDKTTVCTATHDNIEGHRYHVLISLPGGCVFNLNDAIGLPLRKQEINCLIGRDILKHGIFVYDGRTQKITFESYIQEDY